MRIKQSVCFPMVKPPSLSLDSLCEAAAAIGYPAVELWYRDEDFEETVDTARRHDLEVASMSGHRSLEDGLNHPDNHDQIEQELRDSIRLAARHRIPGLICFSGNRRPECSDFEGLLACAQGLKRVAPYAEEQGINLNLELLNSRIDHPGYQCDRPDWGIAVCEMVSSPRVKLLFDIYHMQIMQGDVIRTLRKMIGHVGHIHTAGNPGRNEIDDTQELNYRGICRAIAATAYGGYVGHEFLPVGDPIEALHQAFRTCDQG